MYGTSVDPLFWVSIENTVEAENRLIDKKSKVVPSDHQMVWEDFGDVSGGVFSVFSTFFGLFYPPFIVKNAYSGNFGRFQTICGVISSA